MYIHLLVFAFNQLFLGLDVNTLIVILICIKFIILNNIRTAGSGPIYE